MSLTQYFEYQKDQNMTILFNFTRTQERRRDEVFVCFRMNKSGGLYSSGGGNMNRMPFNEG